MAWVEAPLRAARKISHLASGHPAVIILAAYDLGCQMNALTIDCD